MMTQVDFGSAGIFTNNSNCDTCKSIDSGKEGRIVVNRSDNWCEKGLLFSRINRIISFIVNRREVKMLPLGG